jgi:hypothetical protein
MKNLQTTIPALYTKWVNTSWLMLTGRPEPAKVLTPKAAQVAADQEWEDEGGSVKPAKKPGTEPGPKIPL